MVKVEIPLWIIHSTSPAAQSAQSVVVAASKEASASSFASKKNDRHPEESLTTLLRNLSGTAGRCAVYSIDTHPDHTRFVTAGGDGVVRIWSTEDLFSSFHASRYDNVHGYESHPSSSEGESEAEKSDGEASDRPPPRRSSSGGYLLCALTSHTGSVLSVRFSHSGEYLASAGDDGHVLIYRRHRVASAAASETDGGGSNNPFQSNHREHWSRVHTCRGHSLDVVGLAFSPDDSHLISCSLDKESPIIVWKFHSGSDAKNAGGVIRPLKILGREGDGSHLSTIKGVAFDPVGKFIVSSGDDPCVCVWRCSDWGLEERLDCDDKGLCFASVKKKKKKEKESNGGKDADDTEDGAGTAIISGLSLFRRLSFSPDGSHICVTNGVIRGKNVASMIPRDGWGKKKKEQDDVVNLVGHKQPVVCSRPCPYFFQKIKPSDADVNDVNDINDIDNDGDDQQEDYATLVALGDKRGFLTVWSTASPKPLFKCQCSESRCTITDLAWGRRGPNKDGTKNNNIRLFVSMLDGHVVLFDFDATEVGKELSEERRRKLFREKYGIEGQENVRVGNDGPKLIESVVQFALEEQEEDMLVDVNDGANNVNVNGDDPHRGGTVRVNQLESRSKGKKRIRPVLVNLESDASSDRNKTTASGTAQKIPSRMLNLMGDAALPEAAPKQNAMQGVESATSNAEAIMPVHPQPPDRTSTIPISPPAAPDTPLSPLHPIYSIDLPTIPPSVPPILANVTNHIPQNHSTAKLSLSQGGTILHNTLLTETTITAIAASATLLTLGSKDGSLYFFTPSSPTLKWKSGRCLSSHTPFIFPTTIVSLRLLRRLLLVLTACGTFGVYDIQKTVPAREYGGTILPAFYNLCPKYDPQQRQQQHPKVIRATLTESGVLLVLQFKGTVHGYLYHPSTQLWCRACDGVRFSLSDYSSFLPPVSTPVNAMENLVANISRRKFRQTDFAYDASSPAFAGSSDDPPQRMAECVTRAHCEDRMACSLLVRSRPDFEIWFRLFLRKLSQWGDLGLIRNVVDCIVSEEEEGNNSVIAVGRRVLEMGAKDMLKVCVGEMGRNRALQRITTEIAGEMEKLDDGS